jgi:transcriptional regulator with XRE-family HTH domain
MATTLFALERIDMSAFAERLRLLRSARQITQARLANLLDVNPRVYNRWERGLATPQLDTVVRIADILQVTLDELAGRTPAAAEPEIHNQELLNLYQHVDSLPDTEQQALILVIDSFVRKTQVQKVIRRLAIALGVSSDTLVFDEGERGPDDALRYQFETIARMPEQEQQLVRGVLDALILKNQVAGAIARVTENEKPGACHRFCV